MESTILGLVIDSSILVKAERQKLTVEQMIEGIQGAVGAVPLILCSLTVAEMGHGIYRSQHPEIRSWRRAFLNRIKRVIPIRPITEDMAEIIARIGGEQAAKGINLPLADLIIGACALEAGCGVITSNVRDFQRIPGLLVKRF